MERANILFDVDFANVLRQLSPCGARSKRFGNY